MSSTWTNKSISAMKELLGVSNHQVFWRMINALSEEEWKDANGKDCKPKKVEKNFSFFTPNQVECVAKKYGIKEPK